MQLHTRRSINNDYAVFSLDRSEIEVENPGLCSWWQAAVGIVAGSIIGSQGSKKAAKTAAGAQREAIEEQRRQFDITQKQMAPYREAGLRGLSTYERMLGQQDNYELPEAFSYQDFDEEFTFGADEFEEYKDPGYEFRVDEGLRAIDRRMARSGQRGAGVRPRALMELGQNLASQEYGFARRRALQDYGLKQQKYESNKSLALQKYKSQVAREEESYGRSYTDPLARYGRLSQIGSGATQELGRGRQSYAQNMSQNLQNIGQYQAAGTLGQYGAYATGIGALGSLYSQNQQQNQPQQIQAPKFYSQNPWQYPTTTRA